MTKISLFFRGRSKTKKNLSLLHKRMRKPKFEARINKDTNKIPLRTVVKFEKEIYNALNSYLLQNNFEQFCFLFCHVAVSQDQITFIPKKIIVFENNQQIVQQHQASICVDKTVVNEAYVRFIESEYTAIINCHSHPFENHDVWFSGVDDESDIHHTRYALTDLTRAKREFGKDSNIYYLSFVLGQETVAARYYDLDLKRFVAIDKLVVLDDPIKYILPTNSSKKKLLSKHDREILDRQILAFGESGQKVISTLSVSIIGVGGVGSIVVEGLARLGVRNFTLVDPDKIEPSNLNRFQGASYEDIHDYKVNVCKRNLQKFFPDVQVKAISSSLFTNEVVEAVKNSDIILGCLDGEETRYFLNRLSLQYLLPYIDAGVVIRSDGISVSGLFSRLAVVIPGLTRCLNCSRIQYYDEMKARLYFLDSGTKNNLQKNGYIGNSDDITAPSVYPLNLGVSSYVLFEFLNIFTGYKSTYWNLVVDYMNLNSDIRKCLDIKQDIEQPTGNCLNCESYKGVGDYESLNYFLSQNRKFVFPEM
jgi:hypothetical protein